MPRVTEFDVAIVGAGPAGTSAARLLASWGHRVALVHKAGDGVTLAESIAPSARRLFDALSISGAIDRVGFRPWRGNTVWWGDEQRVESFPAGVQGLHVLRSEFDRLLRSLAASASAVLIDGIVRGVSNDEVAIEGSGADRVVRAPFVLDCSGRAGVLARSFHLRSMETAYRTVALTGIWTRADGWTGLESTHTLVETYGDGWLWSVPIADDRRQVTVMIDPRTTSLDRASGAQGAYLSEVAKARRTAAALEGARLVDGAWGSDASLYTASAFHGSNFLLVGDAGASLDPLSSFGVKRALASGWLASIVAHTWLERPSMRAAALEFFDAREREVSATYERFSRDFSAAAAMAHPQTFWTTRALADPADGDQAIDVAQLRHDPNVLRAFERIRAAPFLRVRRSPEARIEPRAAIAGREIVMQDAVVHPSIANGLRYLRGVDVPWLVAHAPQHADAGVLFDAYNRDRAPVDLPDFLGALAVLVAWRVLEDF